VLNQEVFGQIVDVAERAARRAAARYGRRDDDAWREVWGFIVANVSGRVSRMSDLPRHFDFWLKRSAQGEAMKYYRDERRFALV